MFVCSLFSLSAQPVAFTIALTSFTAVSLPKSSALPKSWLPYSCPLGIGHAQEYCWTELRTRYCLIGNTQTLMAKASVVVEGRATLLPWRHWIESSINTFSNFFSKNMTTIWPISSLCSLYPFKYRVSAVTKQMQTAHHVLLLRIFSVISSVARGRIIEVKRLQNKMYTLPALRRGRKCS